MTKFRLRFNAAEIPHWAERYGYPSEDEIETVLAPKARTRGHLTRREFLSLCEWAPNTRLVLRRRAGSESPCLVCRRRNALCQ
jgi:hypothetical protein